MKYARSGGPTNIETAGFLAEFTEVGLGNTAGQQIWKVLMATKTYPFASGLRSQFREEGRAEGRAEGQANSILKVLDRRGVTVNEESRQRINSCTDLETLDTWLDRALIAKQARDLFD